MANCLICGEKTEVKTTWFNGETGKKTICYFDLCEKCKLIPNCFTCLFSKAWYLRYKGRCDKLFKCFDHSRPQCKLFKSKQIGSTKEAYWNHISCKRYRRGEATKREFEEANFHD